MFVWPTLELKKQDKDFYKVVGSLNRLGFFIFVVHLTGYISVDNLSDNMNE